MLDTTRRAKGSNARPGGPVGNNFLLNNVPPASLFQLYTYHVPTDFEYVDSRRRRAGWAITFQPVTKLLQQQFFKTKSTINATAAVDKLKAYAST